jgi:DNA-binding transcriptional LysR family regulator
VELHHLRYFLAVAEEQHFGRAAQRLNMTQPPLSQRIADLENELGVLLFERSSKGARLTEQGQSFLPYARKAVTAFDGARAMARRLDAGTSSSGRSSRRPRSLGFRGKSTFAASAPCTPA